MSFGSSGQSMEQPIININFTGAGYISMQT